MHAVAKLCILPLYVLSLCSSRHAAVCANKPLQVDVRRLPALLAGSCGAGPFVLPALGVAGCHLTNYFLPPATYQEAYHPPKEPGTHTAASACYEVGCLQTFPHEHWANSHKTGEEEFATGTDRAGRTGVRGTVGTGG